jgi:hypothetical protein
MVEPINDQSKAVGIGGIKHLIAEESTLSAESVDSEFSLLLSSTSFKFLTENNDDVAPFAKCDFFLFHFACLIPSACQGRGNM